MRQKEWTPDDLDSLRTWRTDDKLSPALIAQRFQAMGKPYTRHAVKSQLNRMGWVTRRPKGSPGLDGLAFSTDSAPAQRPRKTRKSKRFIHRKTPVSPDARAAMAVAATRALANLEKIMSEHTTSRVSIMDIRDGQCRMVVGREGHITYFCGEVTLLGKSWCAHHAKIVYPSTQEPFVRKPRRFIHTTDENP